MSMSPLDKDSPIPLYNQVRRALTDAIELGHWQLGQQLPTENKLAQSFGVSKITVRQALQQLAEIGYVRREQGRGTFVTRQMLDVGPRELTSFSEEMRRHRLTPTSRVIERGSAEARDRAAEALQLKPGDRVFVLKRLRLASGKPMGIQTAYIPVMLAPGLDGEDLENGSLYELLRTRYGLQPARATETYSAAAVEQAAAELLGMASGSAVFGVERITYLAGGKPLEFVQSVMRGDRYKVVLELAANRSPQATREVRLQ